MNLPTLLAKHLREVYFGGNWTWVNFKEQSADITWQQATQKIHSFNTIAALVFHMNYYVAAAIRVLQGQPLDASDKFSFNHPPIASDADWQSLLDASFQDAETLASLLEQLPEEKLWDTFVDEKYGNYYRTIQGTIEHTHYHLGQITLIKKLLDRPL